MIIYLLGAKKGSPFAIRRACNMDYGRMRILLDQRGKKATRKMSGAATIIM